MRVITGSAKGHRLKSPKGMGTRPMLDRLKEALFSVLDGYGPIRGRVLDLYAGTGSLGIECLSRGAAWADFVEQRGHVCRIIAENLEHTHLADRALNNLGSLPQLYLHVDIDVLDPAEAPGVDYPVVGGLRVGELTRIVQRTVGLGNIAALAITAVNPEKDIDERTVIAALAVIEAALTRVISNE